MMRIFVIGFFLDVGVMEIRLLCLYGGVWFLVVCYV